MASKIYEALPAFLGGKRKMVDIISSHFRGETIADVFMGGGSVSLKVKEMGKRVISSDIAYRSKIIGEALIKNQRDKITEQDVYGLFLSAKHNKFIEKNFTPRHFEIKTAKFLDTAFANVRKTESIRKKLLELLLYKFIICQRNFGSFVVGKQDNEMIASGNEIELLELTASDSRVKKIKNILSHPLPVLMNQRKQINAGIFNNFQKNEVYQMDVFEFLKLMKKRKEPIGTAYFDSPYKNSTEYSKHYEILDKILEERLDVKIDDKAFNKEDALKNFERLFSLSEFIPRWVISMGHVPNSGGGIKGEELLRVVEKFKPAKIYYLDHVWAINNLSGKKQEENVEYLIVTK